MTLYTVSNGPFECFTSTVQLAHDARDHYPQLKGGHIMRVSSVRFDAQLGRLYQDGELVPCIHVKSHHVTDDIRQCDACA